MPANFRKCGHPRSEINERVVARHDNPAKTYSQCRTCAARRQQLKYRNDAAYREAMKADRLAAYHARKQAA